MTNHLAGSFFENPWGGKGTNRRPGSKQADQNNGGDSQDQGGGKPPFSLESIIKNIAEEYNKNSSNGGNGGSNNHDQQRRRSGNGKLFAFFRVIALGVVLLWLSTGFYIVEPDEQGVILRLGEYDRVSNPGLNWKFPDPVETVEKLSVTRLQKEFIGIKQSGSSGRIYSDRPAATIPSSYLRQDYSSSAATSSASNTAPNGSDTEENNSIVEESQMVTGDENIIDMHFYVQWRIKNAKDYLFNIRDSYGESTVRAAAESAMREVVGTTKLYDALSEKRHEVERSCKKILQAVLDKYQTGIEVNSLGILYSYVPPEVRDAYRDIQSAKADKERFINQAITYRNAILPQARGEARAVIEEAESYKAARIDEAIGAAARYELMYEQYKKSPKTIKTKLYIENMERIYANVRGKIITNSEAGAANIAPIIPLLRPSAPMMNLSNSGEREASDPRLLLRGRVDGGGTTAAGQNSPNSSIINNSNNGMTGTEVSKQTFVAK